MQRAKLFQLALALYSSVLVAVQPLVRLKLKRRGRVEPAYLHDVEARFGHYAEAPYVPGALWLHAVSLGEARAAVVLLHALRQQLPGLRVLLTHSTATGWAEGQRCLQPGDQQTWLPWDTPGAVARFLAHFRPAAGVLIETEVWPNLVQAFHHAGVPLLLVNARLNERSLRQAQRLAWLSRPAYAGLAAVFAQSEADAQRLRTLGAPVEGVYGNLKFDATPHPALLVRAQQWAAALGQRPVAMLASSREGEEALWLDAWHDQPAAHLPLWLVVPRHPQRFDEVARLLKGAGLRVWRRSQLADDPGSWPPEALQADVWLGDSLGEMALYYGMARLALLGGSFLPLGGQNLIEAAACGCPVIMGPHTFNFSEAAQQALAIGAAARAADLSLAMAQALHWLQQPQALAAAEQGCTQLAALGAGAASRYAQAIVQTLALDSSV